MEKFGAIRNYALDGRRLPDFINVGYDAENDTIWNPRGYDPCALRRALKRHIEHLDARYAATGSEKRRNSWDDRR
jgi:hypothetical protein